MKSGTFAKFLLISTLATLASLLSGCVAQRTVTSHGEVISQNYVVKHPFQGAQ